MTWYAVAARAGREQEVASELRQVLAAAGIENVQTQVFYGRGILLRVPALNESVLKVIKQVKHFDGFWGGRKPVIVPDEDVAAWERGERHPGPKFGIVVSRKPKKG